MNDEIKKTGDFEGNIDDIDWDIINEDRKGEQKSNGNNFVILMLVIIWPLGLYFMWSQNKFTPTVRISITISIIILVGISVFSQLH